MRTPRSARGPEHKAGARPYYLMRLDSRTRNIGGTILRRYGIWLPPLGHVYADGSHELKAEINDRTNPSQVYILMYETMRKPLKPCVENCEQCWTNHTIITELENQEQDTLL